LASDVELAVYLIESLTTFAVAGADRHVATERQAAAEFECSLSSAETRNVRQSYLLGCASRVRSRLLEMALKRKAQTPKPGSYGALVKLDKPALIAAEMQRWGNPKRTLERAKQALGIKAKKERGKVRWAMVLGDAFRA
jgi:hypothetical protein